MTRSSFFRFRSDEAGDQGFALPFALMLLGVAAVLAAAATYTADRAATRVTREEDGVRAYELAHSGIEWGISNALAGKVGVFRYVYRDVGSLAVTVAALSGPTGSPSGTVALQAVGSTVYGGKAQIGATLDVTHDELTSWTESP